MPEEGRPADTARALTLAEAIVPIVLGGMALGLSFLLFGAAAVTGPLQTAIVSVTAGTMLVGRRAGHRFEAMRDAAIASVIGGFGTIAVLFAVGALLGTWAMSGTLLALGYYLMQHLTPELIYVTTALVTAVIAFSITSAWTAASTVGICMVGIVQQIGLDPAIAAGAVVSGAYFGDKASPLSKKSALAAQAAGADERQHWQEALWTSVPAFMLALALFWWLGEPASRDAMLAVATIDAELHVSPALLLPLAAVLALALLGLPPFMTMFTGAIVGGVVASLLEPARVIAFAGIEGLWPPLALLKGVWQAMATGFVSTTGVLGLDDFLSRGGMAHMLDTTWLIVAALALGGVIEKIGLLHRLIEPLVAAARSTGGLVATAVGAALATNVLAADQTTAISLSGRIAKPGFDARGLDPVVLSRAAADSASVTSPLIPWNSCGAYIAAALGISTFAYAPFAFFNLFSPLVTILFAALGVRMLRQRRAGEPTS